ncbi:hypothetical protein [Actinopolyspora mortivallis]|uniref:hypothetical protein n=1 Tax=Actinopolyspora mortivallis TaxID=33906 RepID=UPI0003651273|nr:hypothetical protein [Actinopolyspora mortivallis]
MRRVALVLLVAAASLVAAGGRGIARSGDVPVAEAAAPTVHCTPRDERLSELSGLVAGPDGWYAVPDGGSRLRVYEMSPRDCSVVDSYHWNVDPYDVEDLARSPDGRLWVADTGDNSGRRDTIAVHVVSPDSGSARLYRMRYPDGPHDAEALLLGRDGVPHVVTKNPFGTAGVYRPVGELDERHPVELERVTTLRLESTDTPGGPVPSAFGSVAVTGAATSAEHEVLAVRTYTEVYLYPVSGSVPETLARDPLRIPLPGEPQGEAVAFTPRGDLLSASEQLGPVNIVPNALELADGRTRDSGTEGSPTPDDSDSSAEGGGRAGEFLPGGAALAVGVLLVVLGVLSVAARRRR